jgi:hypothetical protein
MEKKTNNSKKDVVEKEPFMKLSLSLFIALIGGFLAILGATIPAAYHFGYDFGKNEVSGDNYVLEKENDRLKKVLSDCQLLDSCYATILSPNDKSLINNSDYFIVKGNINFIPSEYHLWLVVSPQNSGLWWSQSEEIIRERNGVWNGRARLGGTRRGEEYTIRIVIADSDAHAMFSSEYHVTGNTLPPAGVKILDEITVIRD